MTVPADDLQTFIAHWRSAFGETLSKDAALAQMSAEDALYEDLKATARPPFDRDCYRPDRSPRLS